MNKIFTLTITIPEKQWRTIWKKYYPNFTDILSEYLFMLKDSYGVTGRSINDILQKYQSIIENQDVMFLRAPINWKTNPEDKNMKVMREWFNKAGDPVHTEIL